MTVMTKEITKGAYLFIRKCIYQKCISNRLYTILFEKIFYNNTKKKSIVYFTLHIMIRMVNNYLSNTCIMKHI